MGYITFEEFHNTYVGFEPSEEKGFKPLVNQMIDHLEIETGMVELDELKEFVRLSFVYAHDAYMKGEQSFAVEILQIAWTLIQKAVEATIVSDQLI